MPPESDAQSSLFPLPLSAFERYMLEDDSAQYPMIMLIHYVLRGDLRREEWEQAFNLALARHPLLTARLGPDWQWEYGRDRSDYPRLQWVAGEDDPVVSDCRPMDLENGAGLRVFVQPHGNGWRVSCQAHHAVSDGLGMMGFFGDWLTAYNKGKVSDACLDWSPTVASALPGRGDARWKETPKPVSSALDKALLYSRILLHAGRFFFRRVAPVEGNPATIEEQDSTATIHHVTLDTDTTNRLLSAARHKGVSLNDLAIESLFRTLGEWNAGKGIPGSRKWLAFLIPVNLRTAQDALMPVANVMSYVFMARRQKECAAAGSLLRGIADETREMRDWNFGQCFLVGLGLAQRIPGFIKWWISAKYCHTTAVLSNLGVLERDAPGLASGLAGGQTLPGVLTLEKVVGATPLHRGTRLACVLLTVQGELTLCLRHDPRWLGSRDVDILLTSFKSSLLDHLA